MTNSKNSDMLYGVGCDVVNCKYHGHDNRCFAENINVGSNGTAQNATNKAETYCGTFVARPSGV